MNSVDWWCWHSDMPELKKYESVSSRRREICVNELNIVFQIYEIRESWVICMTTDINWHVLRFKGWMGIWCALVEPFNWTTGTLYRTMFMVIFAYSLCITFNLTIRYQTCTYIKNYLHAIHFLLRIDSSFS